jgi:hypothetical protein
MEKHLDTLEAGVKDLTASCQDLASRGGHPVGFSRHPRATHGAQRGKDQP